MENNVSFVCPSFLLVDPSIPLILTNLSLSNTSPLPENLPSLHPPSHTNTPPVLLHTG